MVEFPDFASPVRREGARSRFLGSLAMQNRVSLEAGGTARRVMSLPRDGSVHVSAPE